MPRVWVISELYYPEESATGHILTGIAEGLARWFDVEVLCGQPNDRVRGLRAPRSEERHGVRIMRCVASTLDKNIIAFRFINLITISFSLFFRSLTLVQRRDVVLVVTNPPSLPFLVSIACRMKGAPCVLIVHDVYPELAVRAGLFDERSVAALTVDVINRWLYRHVEKIVTLGRDMKGLVCSKVPGRESLITIIPNWADLEEVRPLPRRDNPLLERLHLRDKFVVLYAGNMGRTHGIEDLVAAAALLAGHDDVRFLCVGGGAKKAWLEREIEKHGLSNVVVLPHHPRKEQSVFLNACDISMIPFVRGMVGVSVPSRMYNIFAAGKPVIAVADTESELAMVVAEHNLGWIIRPGSPDALANAILAAREDRAGLTAMGKRARRVMEEQNSFDHAIGLYRSLVSGLFVKSSSDKEVVDGRD